MATHEEQIRTQTFFAAIVLTFVGNAMYSFGSYRSLGMTMVVSLGVIKLALVAGFGIAGWLRRPVTLRLANAMMLIVIFVTMVQLWVNQSLLVASGTEFAPFIGIKVTVLGLALLVPGSYVVNLILIGLLAAETLFLWFVYDMASLDNALAAGEPWFTMLYFTAAAGVLVFRMRDHVLRARLARTAAQAEAVTEAAQMLLRIRDRTNTPLQNILTATELLAAKHPELDTYTGPIRRAVNNLEELGLEMKKYDAQVPKK